MFETRNSSSGIDVPHPITSLSSSFPLLSLGWSQFSHKSPLARKLKVSRSNCLEDRWVESQLKRWTFVSLQYGSVTDSTTSSFLALSFILHTIMQNRHFFDVFQSSSVVELCGGSIRPYCSPRLRNVQKSASIFRPMIDWERETYERLSKMLRFTFWNSWMYLISNCIFYFAQKHFVGRSIQGGWLSFEQLRWFTTFIRQAPLNCFLVKVLLQIGKNHKWSTFFVITNKGYLV